MQIYQRRKIQRLLFGCRERAQSEAQDAEDKRDTAAKAQAAAQEEAAKVLEEKRCSCRSVRRIPILSEVQQGRTNFVMIACTAPHVKTFGGMNRVKRLFPCLQEPGKEGRRIKHGIEGLDQGEGRHRFCLPACLTLLSLQHQAIDWI